MNNNLYETLNAVCIKSISSAEEKTSAEIVAILVPSSDDYAVAHYRCSLLLAVVGASFGHFTEGYFDHSPISFSLWGMGLGILLGGLVAHIPKLKRFFLHKKECFEESRQRAIQIFYEKGLHTLPERNALLLFVSELEREIHLLADIALKEKVEQKEWDQVIAKMSEHFKKKSFNQGLIEGIGTCAEILHLHYPGKMTNRGSGNQFSNQLNRE